MIRPRKRYTVYDLRKLKGKRCLSHIHVKSPEEARAAEEAGIDLMSCSFDSPESQARLPGLVEAAPTAFLSGATPHGMASTEEAIRIGFRALEVGASSNCLRNERSPERATANPISSSGFRSLGH